MLQNYLLVLLFCVCPLLSAESKLSIKTGPNQNICGLKIPAKSEKPYGLIIWFHGGMNSAKKDKGLTAYSAIVPFVDSSSYLFASPSSFSGQNWLSKKGMENIKALLNYILKNYPVNRNNINLAGVSDGCLAVIHLSLKTDYPIHRRLLFSSFPGLVIDRSIIHAQKILYQGEWHFFQGGKDRLFPASKVLPLLQFWEQTVPDTYIHWYPDGLHDFSYYTVNAAEDIKKIFK